MTYLFLFVVAAFLHASKKYFYKVVARYLLIMMMSHIHSWTHISRFIYTDYNIKSLLTMGACSSLSHMIFVHQLNTKFQSIIREGRGTTRMIHGRMSEQKERAVFIHSSQLVKWSMTSSCDQVKRRNKSYIRILGGAYKKQLSFALKSFFVVLGRLNFLKKVNKWLRRKIKTREPFLTLVQYSHLSPKNETHRNLCNTKKKVLEALLLTYALDQQPESIDKPRGLSVCLCRCLSFCLYNVCFKRSPDRKS